MVHAAYRAKYGGAAAANKIWESRNPEKARAHKIVENAIVAGHLKKNGCVFCGEKAHAHHEDYGKPLKIVWLCPKHHKERHRQLADGTASNIDHLAVSIERVRRGNYNRSGYCRHEFHHIRWLDRVGAWCVQVRVNKKYIRQNFKDVEEAKIFRDGLLDGMLDTGSLPVPELGRGECHA